MLEYKINKYVTKLFTNGNVYKPYEPNANNKKTKTKLWLAATSSK
jgi:hypothetical protein